LPAIGHLPLSKIRHSMLQDLVNKWVAEGLSANTVRQHVNWMRPIFERAVRDDLIPKNPANGLELPKIASKEPRALTASECRSLIAAIDEFYVPLIEILLATGLRWSELANLNIADFDRAKRTLKISGGKTEAGNRTIVIDDSDVRIITKHLMATGRTAAPPDSPLLTSPEHRRLDYQNFTSRFFTPACKKAELHDVTIHSLRRTHATMLISAGTNAKAVQHRMGHASIQTTLKHYASSTEEDRQAAASAKGEYMRTADATTTEAL
jgi:integrase